MKAFFKSLYLSNLVFYITIFLVVMFVLAFVFPVLFGITQMLFFVFILMLLVDGIMLYRSKKGIFARREAPDRLSNGDENPLSIYLENHYDFPVQIQIIDEIPFQFQKRDLMFRTTLRIAETQILEYTLRPTKRGEYSFGAVDRKSTRLNSSHRNTSRMPSSA